VNIVYTFTGQLDFINALVEYARVLFVVLQHRPLPLGLLVRTLVFPHRHRTAYRDELALIRDPPDIRASGFAVVEPVDRIQVSFGKNADKTRTPL